ncbi:MAG: hypothetical protein JW929_05320 [Anaerolineales bacterium]|nr:hypothetical protein [Anaerolineales bacterium]
MIPSRKTHTLLAAAVLLFACALPGRGYRSAATGPALGESAAPEASEAASPDSGAAEYLARIAELGYGKYLAESDERRSHSVESGWDVYRYDPADCRCLLGGEYFIAARKGSEETNTVIWLEGGGACFPGRDECIKNAERSFLRLSRGLATADRSNPVRDWNYLYVPYCDGSLHLGDADADYDGDGAADHWHWGLKNTSAAVRLMRELFPHSREILVAGCSAGGYGTLGTAPMVRLQFPQADMFVFNESGLGLQNPSITAMYRAAYQTWNIVPLIPAECPQCSEQLAFMNAWMLGLDRRLAVGVFSSYGDAVFTENWAMRPEDYRALLLETTGQIHSAFPAAFQRYLVDGDAHCVGDYSYSVGGVSIWEWIEYMLSKDWRWGEVLE